MELICLFLNFSHVNKIVDLLTFNASANSSSVRVFIQQCLQFGIFELFWLVWTFFVFQIKIIIFESSKPILTCFNWWSKFRI